ncbi:MAG: VWA domain-containing protein, partial [Limisphaerales bacterium]
MNGLHLILVALLGFASAFGAETLRRPQHNFLFIVDSSSSMEQRKPAAIKMVKDVIASRFDGQIEAGDSIDIWTYDTENNLRGFPPQIWTSTNAAQIIESATHYLQQYQFKGRSEFANVATDLNLLVPQTKSLLIVIITDGEQPFAGINLDLEINGYLAQKGKIGTQSKAPLLVSLAAINGIIRTWTAYFGEGSLALASLPGRKAKLAAAPPVKEKTKPIVKTHSHEPVVKLDASPSESFSTFNFPPGTRFNPADESAVPAAGEKPLTLAQELKQYQARQAKKSSATNSAPVNKALQLNQKPAIAISTVATNLLVAAHTTNLVKTNLQAAAVVQSNAVKTATNNPAAFASVTVNTNQGTNNIAATASTTRP